MQSAAPVGQGRYPHVPHDAWHAQFATGTPGRAKHAASPASASTPHVPVPSAYTGVTAPPSLHVMQSAAPVGDGRYPHVPHDAWHAQFATGTPGRTKHPPDASAATP